MLHPIDTFRRFGWLAVLGAAVACTGGGDKSSSTDDEDTTEDTTDTGERQIRYFEPTGFIVSGAFGYDAETGTVITVTDADGTSLPPAISILVVNDRFNTTQNIQEDACIIEYAMDPGAMAASWVDGSSVWFGFELPEGTAGQTNCVDWDPDIYDGDPLDLFGGERWGVGINAINANIQAQIDAAIAAGQIQPSQVANWVGGGAWSPWIKTAYGIPTGYIDQGIGQAYLLGDDLKLQVSGSSYASMAKEDIWSSEDGLGTGYYITQSASFNIAGLL